MSYREEQPRVGFDPKAERISSLIPKQGPRVMDDLAKLWEDDVTVEYPPSKSSRQNRVAAPPQRTQLPPLPNSTTKVSTSGNSSSTYNEPDYKQQSRSQEEDINSTQAIPNVRNEKEGTFQKVIHMIASLQDENQQLKERLQEMSNWRPPPQQRFTPPSNNWRSQIVDTGYTITGPPQDWSTPVYSENNVPRRKQQPPPAMSFGGMQMAVPSISSVNAANTNRHVDAAAKLRKLL